jgi:hypothetical protein
MPYNLCKRSAEAAITTPAHTSWHQCKTQPTCTRLVSPIDPPIGTYSAQLRYKTIQQPQFSSFSPLAITDHLAYILQLEPYFPNQSQKGRKRAVFYLFTTLSAQKEWFVFPQREKYKQNHYPRIYSLRHTHAPYIYICVCTLRISRPVHSSSSAAALSLQCLASGGRWDG